MITELKSGLKSHNNKRLLSNFFSLSILQGVNYILPLITLPYLIRVLGTEYFGLLAFATVTIRYFGILTDFGFSLSAAREISIHRDNKEKIIEIFSAVMIIKIILAFLSLILLALFIFSFDKFTKHWEIYFLTFGIVIGDVVFPVWFFQGMEQMRYITYLNVLSKFIFTGSIFIFVREQGDYFMVPAFTSLGFIIAGIWSLLLIRKRFRICFEIQSINTIRFYIKKGVSVFAAVAFSSLYRESNIFILGLFASNAIVGNYAVAEKLIKTVQSLQVPAGQTLFPFFSKRNNKDILRNFTLKYSKQAFFIYFIIWALVFFLSEKIIHVLLADFNKNIIDNFHVLSYIIIIGGMNYYFGILGLLSMGKDKDFSKSVAIAGFINIILCFILSHYLQDRGSALSLVISELVLLIIIRIKLYKCIAIS